MWTLLFIAQMSALSANGQVVSLYTEYNITNFATEQSCTSFAEGMARQFAEQSGYGGPSYEIQFECREG